MFDKVTVFVPGTKGGAAIPASLYNFRIHDVLTKLGNLFGGANAADGIGSWVNSDGMLELEECARVFSLVDGGISELQEATVEGYAYQWKEGWEQQTVLVSIEKGIEGKLIWAE